MLPKPSLSVGGDIHFMIGVKYLRYHSKLIYQLPSGLAIYESVFNNADGGTGVIGGPHPIFTKINQHFFNQSEVLEFCSSQYKLFKTGIKVDPGITMLSFPSNLQKRFEGVEMAGSEITYRCNNCRNCKTCKNSDHQVETSIKEEVEQEIINSSVTINLQTQIITARLPFIHNPSTKMAPNKNIALKVYYQQLKKLNNNLKDKDIIIDSEAKLQSLGFVDYVHNLSPDQQDSPKSAAIQNYIPWCVVWKMSSLSNQHQRDTA